MRRPRAVLPLLLVVALAGCSTVRRWTGRGDKSTAQPVRRERPKPTPIDLNTASRRKLEALPGVTPSMAKRIAAGRPYKEPHELVDRGILTEREFNRVEDWITVPDAR
jgi:competence protein ComEA